MDGWMGRQTDRPSYRDACTRLKLGENLRNWNKHLQKKDAGHSLWNSLWSVDGTTMIVMKLSIFPIYFLFLFFFPTTQIKCV